MPPYVVDSNFFIQAHRQHYPFDVVPNFWVKLKSLADRGLIVSIDKVKAELFLNKDDLTTWCRSNLSDAFFSDTSLVIGEYAQVIAWANSMNGHYKAQALTDFLQAETADAWLVSYAMRNNCKIVTHEISRPEAKNRIKIPEACAPFGRTFLNTIDMFRELQETF